jgi:protein arginine kinase activator
MNDTPTPEPGTCENCGKAPASVKIRRVAGGEETDLHLCLECARERGLEPVPEAGAGSVDLVTLMLKNLSAMEESAGVCEGCGLTYTRFKETGRLGCAQCYQAFRSELTPLIRRVQGEVHHVGKVPHREESGSDRAARLRRLNEDLERAIGAEEYERAAELRDRIQDLEAAATRPRKVPR